MLEYCFLNLFLEIDSVELEIMDPLRSIDAIFTRNTLAKCGLWVQNQKDIECKLIEFSLSLDVTTKTTAKKQTNISIFTFKTMELHHDGKKWRHGYVGMW